MCKMRKLRVSLIAIVMFLFCSVGFASAQTMMLEYDGGTHEYKGEIYAACCKQSANQSAAFTDYIQ